MKHTAGNRPAGHLCLQRRESRDERQDGRAARAAVAPCALEEIDEAGEYPMIRYRRVATAVGREVMTWAGGSGGFGRRAGVCRSHAGGGPEI